jgi:hypothetical protein
MICCKKQYTLDDRNSIRRIMLGKFDENLIEVIKNEQFYNNVKYPLNEVGL